MLWSHTAFQTLEWCPSWFYHQYVLKDTKRTYSPEAELGTLVHDMAQRFVLWRMSLNRAATKDEALAFLESLVDDVREEDGIVSSPKTSAAWMIENGFPLFKQVLSILERADEWGVETAWYFDGSFRPVEKADVRYGWDSPDYHVAIADVWARKGDVLTIIDWKSGQRYPKWEQLRGYGALGRARFPEVDRARGIFAWLASGVTDEGAWVEEQLGTKEIAGRARKARKQRDFPTSPGHPQCSFCAVTGCPDRLERKKKG